VEVDHVVLGVADPHATAKRLEADYGLRAVEGVRFEGAPGFGNWLVPLGAAYVELLAIADPAAANHDLARGFQSLVAAGDRWLGWALHVSDLEAVAKRLGHSISRRSLIYVRDGRRFEWDLLAFEERLLEPYLPFFLRWEEPKTHADLIESLTDETGNRDVANTIDSLQLRGDGSRLRGWLGDFRAPVEITDGEPAMTSVVLGGPHKKVVLR
jgi:hypothetical protein